MTEIIGAHNLIKRTIFTMKLYFNNNYIFCTDFQRKRIKRGIRNLNKIFFLLQNS